VRRDVTVCSPCRLAYKPILQFDPSENVTSRQHAAHQRAVWRLSLATGQQDDSAKMRRLALCRVVASAKATHKGVPNQPPYRTKIFNVSNCINYVIKGLLHMIFNR
jgi:hypothetical protein